MNAIPDSWREARLILIKKEGKDGGLPGSYCPISLLNLNYQLLTSIMAERFNKITGFYAKEDLTGFIHGRFMNNNIRKLTAILDLLQRSNKPAVIAFLDTEKAFDCIEWSYQ